MQQRQLRLGDILDDYCPRERRVTNHAVVAMVGDDVKQTRCTTCEAEHVYKHAKVPRQRRKGEEPAALYSQVLAGGPKRVAAERPIAPAAESATSEAQDSPTEPMTDALLSPANAEDAGNVVESHESSDTDERAEDVEDGPVHRPLIRATLPRQEGQAPPARPAPEFTIRQPGGRPNRFRGGPNQRGGHTFQGNRSGGSMSGGPGRGGPSRQSGGRPPQGTMNRSAHRHDADRKRSK